MGDMDGIAVPQDRDWWLAVEFGNEPSGSIKHWEFLDLLRTG